jgi:cysteine desulfurase
VTYLDHAATTPMRPEALRTYLEAAALPGNASSLHASGRLARRGVEESRERLAAALGARPSEVIFTAGGTEADNTAVKGLYWARRAADPRRVRILVGAGEHPAVLDAAEWLAIHQGARREDLRLDAAGRVRPEVLAAAIEADPDSVALISVMWANNEVGTVNPVAELAALSRAYGIPFHTDAVQAVGAVPVDFAAVGADALSLSGHKVGGPVGAGALLLRRGANLAPLLHGGGQERDVRSGTLDAPAIAALATAVELAVAEQPAESVRLAALRDDLLRRLLEAVPDAVLNGAPPGPGRLPANAHLTFPACEGDSLLLLLDARGIECSTGSACSAGVARPSHVLLAMGFDEATARGCLRFSLGRTSTPGDVDALVDAIGPVVGRARRAGALAGMTR